jgi:hypothetical protein
VLFLPSIPSSDLKRGALHGHRWKRNELGKISCPFDFTANPDKIKLCTMIVKTY